jgi:hypothetical protein
MSGTCDIYGRDEKLIKFQSGKMKEKDHMEGPDVDRRTILRCILQEFLDLYSFTLAPANYEE